MNREAQNPDCREPASKERTRDARISLFNIRILFVSVTYYPYPIRIRSEVKNQYPYPIRIRLRMD